MKPSQYPADTAQRAAAAKRAPRAVLVSYRAISLSTYNDGVKRALCGRLDTATRRMVFEQLALTVRDYPCGYGDLHMLCQLAWDLSADRHECQLELGF